MGDIKRKRRRYVKPRKLYDSKRIEEENRLLEKYGLKSKREIWKAETLISKVRKRAKLLIPASDNEKAVFLKRLYEQGLNTQSIGDVLALTKEDWLDRRLQTILFKKGLAKTLKQARQLIVHKNVLIGGEIVNSPSFIVKRNLDDQICLKSGGKNE